MLRRDQLPTPQALNRLLSKCRESTHPPQKLAIAFKRSLCNLSIFEEESGKLVGFVRATSDHGLNANLWNLVAQPGDLQEQFLAVLVHHALTIIRREMPGCSVSVSAASVSLKALEHKGFLIDPGGIRAMGLRL